MAEESIFSKLSAAIKPFAPLLSTALSVLPVPGAQVVGKVLEAAFDGNIDKPDELAHKITLDPNAALKLAEIESNNRVQLENIAMQQAYNMMSHDEKMYAHEVEDKKNARETPRHENEKWIPGFLVGSLTVGLGAILASVIGGEVQGDEVQIIMLIAGMLVAKYNSIIDFFFGTNQNSRNKDEILTQMRVKH